MSDNSPEYLCSYISRKRSYVLMILLVWAGLTFVAVGDPALAGEGIAVSVRSPLRMTGIESAEQGMSLELAADAYSILRQHRSVRLTEFQLSRHESVELELERFYVTTSATRIVAGTPSGDVPVAPPDIALFRGRVIGVDDSHVILGISPRGANGFIRFNQDRYVLTPQREAKEPGTRVNHVIHKLSEFGAQMPGAPSECGVQTTPIERSTLLDISPAEAVSVQFRVCRLALECDYEFWDRFNDFGLALDYIFTLFGTVTEIYERDVSVKLALTYIRIWTTINDPYSYVGGNYTGLQEFMNYWNANHNPGQQGYIERDLAHLLSGRGVGAWGNQARLCSYNEGYSISGGIADPNRPTLTDKLLHDIYLVSHEIGHNFNGTHTTCFDPPLDKCVADGCNDTQDCNTAPGTIMSYCHYCPGGYTNILHEFHTKNIERIRGHVDQSCLRIARDPSYVDWRNTSGTEDGTATFPYNTFKEGVEAVLPGGTVIIASGNYLESWSYPENKIRIWQPMTLKATGGNVIIRK